MITLEFIPIDGENDRVFMEPSEDKYTVLGEPRQRHENVQRDTAQVRELIEQRQLRPFKAIVMHLEDCIVNVQRGEQSDTHTIRAFDALTGAYHVFFANSEETRAILILGFIGEDTIDDAAALYALAEPRLIGCPHNCRMIP